MTQTTAADAEGFFRVARAQRAYRDLSSDPIPDDVIERILEAGTWAPSGENAQPWVFIVVRDQAIRTRFAEITAQLWDTSGREMSRPKLAPAFLDDVDRWAMGGLAKAPVHIVICADGTLTYSSLFGSSIFPATQNIMLAAQACGLGTLMSTLTLNNGPEVQKLLALPDHIQPMALIPLGYPVKQLGLSKRIPVAQKTFRDRYGETW